MGRDLVSQRGASLHLKHFRDVALTASSDRPFRSWIVLLKTPPILCHVWVCVLATSVVLS